MECERWLNARLNDLKRRSAFDEMLQGANVNRLPDKLQKSFSLFNPSEMNVRGESLVMSVVKYESDRVNQIKYISMLVRAGCDPSTADARHLRTPLMVACMSSNEDVANHLIALNCNITLRDRMGNNALMYAARHCHSNVVKRLMFRIATLWAFEAYTAKNSIGQTAEIIARTNDRILFAKMLRKERKRMATRLNMHLAYHLKCTKHYKTWNFYAAVFRAQKKFMSLKKNSLLFGLRGMMITDRIVTAKPCLRSELLSRNSSTDQLYAAQNHSQSKVRVEKEYRSTPVLPKLRMYGGAMGNKITPEAAAQVREALSF